MAANMPTSPVAIIVCYVVEDILPNLGSAESAAGVPAWDWRRMVELVGTTKELRNCYPLSFDGIALLIDPRK
jgi:hypothetical protein